jgi:hypothetical protein
MNEKNRVFTPKESKTALNNLPTKYVAPVMEILDGWSKNGLISKTYSQNYIVNVRNGKNNAFNEDIMQALVLVGLNAIEKKKQFGRITKKTSQSN